MKFKCGEVVYVHETKRFLKKEIVDFNLYFDPNCSNS